MKKLVCFCMGGISNRIVPIASCIAYKKRNPEVELSIVWNPHYHVDAYFRDLFEENDLVIHDSVDALHNYNFDKYYIESDLTNLGHFLHVVSPDKQVHTSLEKFFSSLNPNSIRNINAEKIEGECVLLTHHSYIEGLASRQEVIYELSNLRLSDEVDRKITLNEKSMGIGKDWVSVHARGSDFRRTLDSYIPLIEQARREHPGKKILFCSEMTEWVNEITNKFEDCYGIEKSNNSGHIDHEVYGAGVYNKSKECCIDGMVEMILMSRTAKVYGESSSTFFTTAEELREYNETQ